MTISASQRAFRLPVRPEHAGIEPYGAPQLDVPHLLNVNENPYGPDANVVAAIARDVAAAASGLNRYPDRDFLDLRADLGAFLGQESKVAVPAEQIWAANGSNEVMLHVMQAFGGPGRTALSFGPTYSMYPEYARDSHTAWALASRESDFTIDIDVARAAIAEHQPSIILLTSPNNPTGTAVPLETISEVCQAALNLDNAGAPAVVVVDEAYGEFRRDGVPSALELLDTFPNLAVSRTMSKAFALAGARIGYLAASRDFVDALRVVRLPYHLSGVTQAVARAALAHSQTLLARIGDLRKERDKTAAWLREQSFDGQPLRVAESDANFIFFGCFPDRHSIWQGLLDRGVLIRETGPEGWLRVSIGTREDMAAFKAALVEVAAL